MNPISRKEAVLALSLLLAVAAAGCGGSVGQESTPDEVTESSSGPVFVDVAVEAGITHRHEKPVLDPKVDNIKSWLASVGAAVAAGDYDNDGWIDLYVTSSRKGSANHLYRNRGDGTFSDVAAEAGVADANDAGGASMDCIWADLDNDGWLDLYVVRWGRDLLYRNNGDGTFADVTRERFRGDDGSPGTPWANGNAVIAFDYNRDGRLDLYVGNYFADVDLWDLRSTRIMHDSFETSRNAGRNFFYRQEADGTFTELARELGLDDTGWTLAVGSADVNNDGWPDLYVANDFGPDKLFYNDGRGSFVDVSNEAIGRDTKKGMNVDFGDFNNDGWLDAYVTNITTLEYLREGNMLWRNNGPGADGLTRFMDVSPESHTDDGGWGWGAKFLDYDNDGDLDLFTVNGFISAGAGNYWYDLASWTVQDTDPIDALNWPEIGERSFSGYEPFRFWRNDGSESFSERASEVGLDGVGDGRGIACVDYDNDGDIDIFVANQGQRPNLFRNDLGPGSGHWLMVDLEGTVEGSTAADAVGARVTLVAGGSQQIRERDGGNGYSGQSDPRLHFGLDEHEVVDLLEVRWPDGGVQYLENVSANRLLTVVQDPREYAARPLVTVGLPEQRERPEDHGAPRVPEIDPVELERLLGGLEEQLRRDSSNHALGFEYRRRCVEFSKHDRAIRFFQELVDRDPSDTSARLELSVAFVDKIPTCGGLAAIVCKGTLARKSLDQLDAIIEQRDDWWAAYYGRGMNHLHWPRALRHTPAALADFEVCLEAQRREGETKSYHERTYVLLGDAYTKSKAFEDARQIWEEGLKVFPGSSALQERLAVRGDDRLMEFVEDQRSLEQPIDTDFSFIAREL